MIQNHHAYRRGHHNMIRNKGCEDVRQEHPVLLLYLLFDRLFVLRAS